MKIIWKNDFISLKAAEVNKIVDLNKDLEAIVNVSKDSPKFSFKFQNSGYDIVSNTKDGFKIDEFNLANLVLLELSQSGEIKYQFPASEEFAKYIISETKTEKEFSYYDGYIYNLLDTRDALVKRIEVFNSKIGIPEVIHANDVLITVLESSEPTKDIINNDLHFNKKFNDREYNKKDEPLFKDVIPIYSCPREQVSGLIKHASNKLLKEDRPELKEYAEKLQKRTPYYPENIKLFKDRIEYFTLMDYIIKPKDEDTVELFSKEKDGHLVSWGPYRKDANGIDQILDQMFNLREW